MATILRPGFRALSAFTQQVRAVHVEVYVGNIHPQVGKTKIESLFSKFKPLNVIYNTYRCSALVDLRSDDNLTKVKGLTFDFNGTKAAFAVDKHSRPGHLFLGPLPSTISTEQIQDALKEFDPIVKIIRPADRQMTVNAFVHFPDLETAQKASEELNRQEFLGLPLKVNVSQNEYRKGNVEFDPNVKLRRTTPTTRARNPFSPPQYTKRRTPQAHWDTKPPKIGTPRAEK